MQSEMIRKKGDRKHHREKDGLFLGFLSKRWRRRFQQLLQHGTRGREERGLQKEPGLDAYVIYTACIFGLFAMFSATTSIKTALWGFGIIHIGFTFGVLGLWWWEERLWSQKNGEAPTRDSVFTKLPRDARSPSVAEILH
jgi:hypothetical protein